MERRMTISGYVGEAGARRHDRPRPDDIRHQGRPTPPRAGRIAPLVLVSWPPTRTPFLTPRSSSRPLISEPSSPETPAARAFRWRRSPQPGRLHRWTARAAAESAPGYMDLRRPMREIAVNTVFIGSCTNEPHRRPARRRQCRRGRPQGRWCARVWSSLRPRAACRPRLRASDKIFHGLRCRMAQHNLPLCLV